MKCSRPRRAAASHGRSRHGYNSVTDGTCGLAARDRRPARSVRWAERAGRQRRDRRDARPAARRRVRDRIPPEECGDSRSADVLAGRRGVIAAMSGRPRCSATDARGVAPPARAGVRRRCGGGDVMRRGRGAAVVPLLWCLAGAGGSRGGGRSAPARLRQRPCRPGRAAARRHRVARATRWERWRTCIRGVPVSERGNVDRRRLRLPLRRARRHRRLPPRRARARRAAAAPTTACCSWPGAAAATAVGRSRTGPPRRLPRARPARPPRAWRRSERRVAQLRQRTRRVERSALGASTAGSRACWSCR